jgi:murein peptide amidase A
VTAPHLHRGNHLLGPAGRIAFIGVVVCALVGARPSYGDQVPRNSSDQTTTRLATQDLARATGSRTVLSQRTIGYSVRRHQIRAYEMGSRRASRTVVVIGAMHGNETEGSTVISAMMAGSPIKGVHIWAVRRDNPDGVLSGHRRNAHDVDLNRNFPTRWRLLTGNYSSGPRPASEPETRALMRFLDRIDPEYVVTMHSPLHGIDVYGAKDRPFARRLAEEMRLPLKSFDCSGVCHGTLTQWFDRHYRGACVTVEFGEHPSSRYLRVGAPRGLVRAIGGHH